MHLGVPMDLESEVDPWFEVAHENDCTQMSGQLLVAITGFMLLVFMSTHSFCTWRLACNRGLGFSTLCLRVIYIS